MIYTWSIALGLCFNHLTYGLRGIGSSSLVRSEFQHQLYRKIAESTDPSRIPTPQESFAKLISRGFVSKDVNLNLTDTGEIWRRQS